MKKLKQMITAGSLGLLALGATVLPALAAPAPKATGGVKFLNGGLVAQSEFQVQDTSTTPGGDKGFFKYADPNGSYRLDVTDVSVGGDDAAFSGPVVESTYPGIPVGAIVYITVHDGGSPGTNGDLINGNVGAPAAAPVIPITEGNLVVH